MMCFTDLYRITQQDERDRLEMARREQLLRETQTKEHRILERLRHLRGTLMALLA